MTLRFKVVLKEKMVYLHRASYRNWFIIQSATSLLLTLQIFNHYKKYISHLSMLTNKTQIYCMMKKAAANYLRNQLKKIPEKHFNQELMSTTKMLASFASKKEKNYTEWIFLKLVQVCLEWLNYFGIRVFFIRMNTISNSRDALPICQISHGSILQEKHQKLLLKNKKFRKLRTLIVWWLIQKLLKLLDKI